VSDIAFSLSPNPAVSAVAQGGWVWGGVSNPTQLFDSSVAANRRKRILFTGSQGYAHNDLLAAQFDIARTFDGGLFRGLQAGYRFEHIKYSSEGYRTSAFGLQTQNIDGTFLAPAPVANDFFNGKGGATSNNWQYVPIDYALSRVAPIAVFPGGELSPLGFNIHYADGAFQSNNFTNQTDLHIGYAMAKYELDIGPVRIRGNGGVRYEVAENTVVALDRISLTNTIGAPSDFAKHTYVNTYDKLLPSFIAVADLTSKLILRAAYYKTYVRPQPRQFNPVTIVNLPQNGVYNITLGNPDLRPYDGTSLDATLEWYNRPGSVIAVAAFKKTVTGLIRNIRDPKVLCPSDATALGLGTLTVNGDVCESSLIYTGGATPVPFRVSASGFVNDATPVSVKGVELNIQQSFDFLPGFLRHLGGGFNYAYTTISGTSTTGTAATLPGVSKHNFNVIGYYETGDFGIRAVYNQRSTYDLAGAGTFTGAARRVRARGQLDLSASINVNDQYSIALDAYNLTDAIRVEYENDPRLIRRADYDGRTFTASVRAKF
jgi:TonB-dependent receptor